MQVSEPYGEVAETTQAYRGTECIKWSDWETGRSAVCIQEADMKLEWHTSMYDGVSKLYVDDKAAAYVYQFHPGVYGVRMYAGSTWILVGEFPTREEAKQCAELLAPIYARFTE